MSKTTPAPSTKSKKKVIVLSIIVAVILGIIGWWVYGATRTYPLGDGSKLEYIGKYDYGCWGFCDSNPSSVYFYATDLDTEEILKSYDRINRDGAKIESHVTNNDGYTDYWISFTDHEDHSLFINYYSNGPTTIDSNHLKKSTKRHVIRFGKESYPYLKKFLY
jgi:hypothetical protein